MDTDTYQISGDHYRVLDPQPWDVATAWNLSFLEGNVLKYLARYKAASGGGLNDLRKARHYIDKIIEQELTDE